MSYFRCRSCNAVYYDYYPPDDTCLKCMRGLIRIITDTSSITQPKEEDQ